MVKLGNELHGPEDEMFITKEHVLFYEDMKADGKVMQAIKEYKANPNAANQQQPAAQPQTQQPVQQQQQQVAPTQPQQ